MRQEMEAVVTEVFDRQLKLLTSIKGIGVTLATALIIATGGFTYFDNAKQLPLYRYLSNNRAVRHEHKHPGTYQP